MVLTRELWKIGCVGCSMWKFKPKRLPGLWWNIVSNNDPIDALANTMNGTADELDEAERNLTRLKEEAEATQKFKTKVPTTLLRGSLNHGDDDDVGVPRRQYSILSGDEGTASMVSLDAVARDLEKQGFHSTLSDIDSDR